MYGNSTEPRRSRKNAAFLAFCRVFAPTLTLIIGEDDDDVRLRRGDALFVDTQAQARYEQNTHDGE